MAVRCSRAVVALVLISTASAAPIPKDPQKSLVYFPTQKGAKWVYKQDDSEATSVVTDVEVKDGAKLVSVGQELNGEIIPSWTVRVSENGIFQTASRGTDLDQPLCLLKLPAKEGEKWEVKQEQDHQKQLKGSVLVVGFEKVETPAGIYTAVRVDWDYTLNGDKIARSYWFAPDVGLVKMKGKYNSMVLKSFTPGK